MVWHDRTMRPNRTTGRQAGAAPSQRTRYQVICGEALGVLKTLPAGSVDMCMTSPPYWGHREYDAHGIGQEPTHTEYVSNLYSILQEVKRILLSRQPWLQSRACAAGLREACRARRSHRLCRDRCRRCRRGRPPSWRELHRGRRCSALCRSLRRCRPRTLSSSHFENLIWPLPISGRRRADRAGLASLVGCSRSRLFGVASKEPSLL
jgi:hypothetical protein